MTPPTSPTPSANAPTPRRCGDSTKSHGPSPWADPAYLDEQHASLSEASWRRFYLNEWTAGDDRFTTLEDVTACVRPGGPLQPIPGVEYVIGVDLGWKHDRTAVAVAHLEPNSEPGAPTVVIDRLDVWAGSRDNPVILDDVEASILATADTFGRVTIKMDPHEGVGMAQRLRAHGLNVIEAPFTAARNSQLARTLGPAEERAEALEAGERLGPLGELHQGG